MIFGSLLIVFFILSHLLVYSVAGEGQYFSVIGQSLGGGFQYLLTPKLTVTYLVVIFAGLVSLAVLTIWYIKLVKAKSRLIEYFQPIIFVFSLANTFAILNFRTELQDLYNQQATRIMVFYLIATALYIMAYGIHVMVFGIFKFSAKEEVAPVVKELKEEKKESDEQKNLSDKDIRTIRTIVREELAKVEPVVVKETVIKEVVNKEQKAPLEEKNMATPKEKVKVEPVVETVDQAEVDFERIPFAERILSFDKDLLEKYEDLKNYILQYDVKSRLSSSGDSFRAKRVMYFKITNSGNSGFKVYYKLDIDSYANTTYPLKDARGIKMYEEVPTFMYLKSDLSLKRAKELVDDVMAANGFTR